MGNELNYILGRRSIRTFMESDIGEETADLLLKAAMAAPSACSKDPWRFIVVRKKDTLIKMASDISSGKMLSSASMAVIVCGDLDSAYMQDINYMLQDCSTATQNILLAAHTLQLGSCWIAIHPIKERIEYINELFSLPSQIIPISCIAIGHPGEVKEARSRYNKDYVHYEKYSHLSL